MKDEERRIEYVRQRGNDCTVKFDGERYTIQDCDSDKLGNTIWDRLGPKYTNREMYKFGFIPNS